MSGHKGPGSFVYREHLGSMGVNFRVDLDNRIVVTVSPLLARSKHVVYTNVVEALNRFVLVNKGYMLLHSATVQLGEETVMLSAQTDTGRPARSSGSCRSTRRNRRSCPTT